MQVGPLFACIIKRQFENLRDGDRFFFSHRRSARKPRSGHSHPQGLPEVAKINIQARSLGAILCDNLEASVLASKTTGKNVFRSVNPRSNQELDCRKLKLGNGKLDLGKIFEEAVNEERRGVNNGFTSIFEPQGSPPRHFIHPNGNFIPVIDHATDVHADSQARHVVGHAAPDLPGTSPYTYGYGARGNLFRKSQSSYGRIAHSAESEKPHQRVSIALRNLFAKIRKVFAIR